MAINMKPYEGAVQVTRKYNNDQLFLYSKDKVEGFLAGLNRELAQRKGIEVSQLKDPYESTDLTPEEAFELDKRISKTSGISSLF